MNTHVYGITGAMGAGKSTISQALKFYWVEPLHIIELDVIRRYMLWVSTEAEHINLRKDLAASLSLISKSEKHWLNRENFTNLIFSSKEKLEVYSKIATPILKKKVQQEISQHKNVLIEWAYLIEEQYTSFINKKVILMNAMPYMVINRFINIKPNETIDFMQRAILEPPYETRVNYLKNHNISFVEYNNSGALNIENIKLLIEQLK